MKDLRTLYNEPGNTMINLRNSPFLWFALLLIGAFVLMDQIAEKLVSSSLGMMLAVCVVTGIFCCLKYLSGNIIWSTLVLSLCVITAGALRYLTYEKSLFPEPAIEKPTKVRLVGTIDQVLKVKDRATTLKCRMVEITSIRPDEQITTDKFVLLRIKGSPLNFLPGDLIKTEGWMVPIHPSLNPHAFDLQAYYRTLGIRHQLSCRDTVMELTPGSYFSLMRTTAKWQDRLCHMIRSNISGQVAQLTNALVFGERSSMDAEIREAFSDAGAMHVLSVSGMHMAIIYSLLYLLLGAPGKGNLRRRLWRLSTYFVFITLYIGITGASPAVVRAGLMIILYILGKSMGWNTGIWNLLGFAAFLMVWHDPFIWKNIGFQLSFLAMAGILFYTQPIIRFLPFKNIMIHRIWQITAVSLAAQIFIFPLILYHFHQFPLTFALSSLIAMPAGYLIIFGALLNILLNPLSIDILWVLFDYTGQLFLQSMQWMAEINPTMNFSMPFVTEVLLLLAACIMTAGLMYEWGAARVWTIGCLMATIFSLGWHRSAQWTKSDLTIYHNYSGWMVDLIDKGHCFTLRDSAVSDLQVEFVARGQRVYRDIISHTPLDEQDMYTRANCHFSKEGYYSSNLSMMFWSRKAVSDDIRGYTRYLLIDVCEDIESLKDFLRENPNVRTILPAHLDSRMKSNLIEFLQEKNLVYHDIASVGYFTIPL